MILDLEDFNSNVGIPLDQSIIIDFSEAVDEHTLSAVALSETAADVVPVNRALLNNGKTVVLDPIGPLTGSAQYTISISNVLKGLSGESFSAVAVEFLTGSAKLKVVGTCLDSYLSDERFVDVPTAFACDIEFSEPIDPASVTSATVQLTGSASVVLTSTLNGDQKTLSIQSSSPLEHIQRYTLSISNGIKAESGATLGSTYSKTFYTAIDPAPKFPVVSDDALLTLVQEQTFKYFWDFAHPTSGMARERNTSGDIVTTGGTGFGLMAILVGIERGFITREEGITRLTKIVDFLSTADHFHGAFPHWMNGNTGDVIPFSTNDNGGDLVETAFLVQGLLTVRQYLNPSTESSLIAKINTLWESVEWDWYTHGGQKVLYWHWSPDKNWIMNFPIRGHNETLITYILAGSSPTHPIDKETYTSGYARDGAIKNGDSFYGITLPLGEDYGGPLFFTHYSFLGLDPRNLEDQYANYWQQNVNHTLINRAYVIDNPKNFVGYGENNWGLTASDNQSGYSAHSPRNDLGVITPTAALSSFPYTPEYSMDALKFFYYTVGDKLWGPYGFYDAHNTTAGWVANSYLAIDQGPIIIMIENYRTALLWDLFMSAPEVQQGLTTLGFTY